MYYMFGVAVFLPEGSFEGVAELRPFCSAHLLVQARVSGVRLSGEDDGQNNDNPEKIDLFFRIAVILTVIKITAILLLYNIFVL